MTKKELEFNGWLFFTQTEGAKTASHLKHGAITAKTEKTVVKRAAITERLQELREELRAERISYSELAELQSYARYIDKDDVELLEAAGVAETQKP